MQKVFLVKCGEIALKGQNRGLFEQQLVSNMKRRLRPLGQYAYQKAQSTITIIPQDDASAQAPVLDALRPVFGIAALSASAVAEKELGSIQRTALEFLQDDLAHVGTFKVECKRSDKKFPLTSPQLSAEVGGYLLEHLPHLKVDVHNPDLIVYVEVRDFAAYVRGPQHKGAGGMPAGTAGRGVLLLSGGIDSPVAAYMMLRRGMHLTAVHFETPPYTSERARMKVEALAEKLSNYQTHIELFCVNLTEISVAIRDNCAEELTTIIMRRFMTRIAERIAQRKEALALVTGESLAQVASQTLPALVCTDDSVDMPILRPLIGFDKSDIVDIARRIDTFELSTDPQPDCCVIFTPRHPKTKPQVDQVRAEEEKLDTEAMIDRAVENAALVHINHPSNTQR